MKPAVQAATPVGAPDPLLSAASDWCLDSIPSFVDELGDIDARLSPLRSLIAREQLLRSAIRDAHAANAAPGEIRVAGARFDCVLGPRGNQTAIDLAKLVRLIKPSAFAKFATCTLAALKLNVADEDIALVVSVGPTGPRGLKVLPRAA